MDRYDGLTREYLHRGMTHRKIAFALSVLLVCVNIGLSHCTIVALADEPAFQTSTTGGDVSGQDATVSGQDSSVSGQDPAVSDNSSVTGNDPVTDPEPQPEEELPEEPSVSDNGREEVPVEEPTEEPIAEENPDTPQAEPEQIANTEYEAVAYEEIAEYFLEPHITQIDRDAEYEDGIYYAYANACYYIHIDNGVSYLVCCYDGGRDYIEVKDGVAVWQIPEDHSGEVSFGYEGTEGTYRELFADVIFHDTTAPSVVFGMDDSYQSRLRVEVSEVGNAKSGIESVYCTVDGEDAHLLDLRSIQTGTWRGEEVSLMSVGTYRDEAGTHEITVTVTDRCGNTAEITETFEILTNGMISVTLPGSFIIPMLYDSTSASYYIQDNVLKVTNHGDSPLDVTITNITVNVDKTLPSNWAGEVTSEALAAAARKSIDSTVSVAVPGLDTFSVRLKEGLNSDVYSFTLGAEGSEDSQAEIRYTGETGEGGSELWESGDFMVHMTFLFAIHMDPKEAPADEALSDAEKTNSNLQNAGLNTLPSEQPTLAEETLPEDVVPAAAAPAEETETPVLESDPGPDGGTMPENVAENDPATTL